MQEDVTVHKPVAVQPFAKAPDSKDSASRSYRHGVGETVGPKVGGLVGAVGELEGVIEGALVGERLGV